MRSGKIIYGLMLMVMLLPLMQSVYPLITEKPLKGTYTPIAKPSFSWTAFDSLVYQEKLEQYASEQFGFRNSVLRIRNQFYFSVFNESPNQLYYVRDDGYLFERLYVEEYYGNNFVGDSTLRTLASSIKLLQDSLMAHHKLLITVIAPSPAFFNSEYLSPMLDHDPQQTKTNYASFVKLAADAKLNCIDANKWFMELKGKTPYPLYSKHGSHWTIYGATLAFDSIYALIRDNGYEGLSVQRAANAMNSAMGRSENDIPPVCNLLFNQLPQPIYYPDSNLLQHPAKKISVLTIGDSYYGTIVRTGMPSYYFTSPDYWFYNSLELQPHEKYDTIKRGKSFLKNELDTHDVFILMVTPHNIPNCGWGFIQGAQVQFIKPEH
jgi:hypothetical protein